MTPRSSGARRTGGMPTHAPPLSRGDGYPSRRFASSRPSLPLLATERDLAALAGRFVCASDLSAGERALLKAAGNRARTLIKPAADEFALVIAAGEDPLGDALVRLRSAEERRRRGAVYTPKHIVRAMVGWAAKQATPARVVDPGAGSGRFLLAAGREFAQAELVAVETDPLAALLLRANAQVRGERHRLTLLVEDYRGVALPSAPGPTLFLGNPPCVRHHDIEPAWKEWFAKAGAKQSLHASRLAGAHVHFLLQTACLAAPGDFGAFITSAEWLDVNYGSVARQLVADALGGTAVHVFAADASPFPNAAATGAIICFRVANKGREAHDNGHAEAAVRFRQVDAAAQLDGLGGGREIPRARLRRTTRWSSFLRRASNAPHDFIELGALCRVHRGQVTGCNAAWIAGGQARNLPTRCLVPTVTRARELFGAGDLLHNLDGLRRVVDLPLDLDELDPVERREIERFLLWARSLGAEASYIARHRPAWWAVRLRRPAPILCTYMARRPPTFVRNPHGARHLNIAHGIYPREAMPTRTLDALAKWLRENVGTASGRTYAGGLTKFEPKEIERLLVPPPAQLQ